MLRCRLGPVHPSPGVYPPRPAASLPPTPRSALSFPIRVRSSWVWPVS